MFHRLIPSGNVSARLFALGLPLIALAGCGMMPFGMWGLDDLLGNNGGLLLSQSFNAAPFTADFTPTKADQTITVWVSGDTGSSRVTFTVTDAGGNIVASFDSPTSNVSLTTFTNADTGVYTLDVTETGTAAATYAVRVVQGTGTGWGMMGSHMWGW